MKTKLSSGIILGVTLVLGLTSVGCATTTSPNTNEWLVFSSIVPSRIENGMNNPNRTIMWHRLGDGTRMEVFFDRDLSFEDARFFYHRLMNDFGWRLHRDGDWEAFRDSPRRPRRGNMYVNPARRVAVYFFPGGGYEILRVRFIR